MVLRCRRVCRCRPTFEHTKIYGHNITARNAWHVASAVVASLGGCGRHFLQLPLQTLPRGSSRAHEDAVPRLPVFERMEVVDVQQPPSEIVLLHCAYLLQGAADQPGVIT